jgi:hypothetical protein
MGDSRESRYAGEMRDAAMDPVGRTLDEAGARWRSMQPEPRPVRAALFETTSPSGVMSRLGTRRWAFVAGAASMAAVLAGVTIALPLLIPRAGGGVGSTPGYYPTGKENCPITRPEPDFSPKAGYPAAIGKAWYGSDDLYVMLDKNGEDWSGLPKSELGLTQKTFWYRFGYDSMREPEPDIRVSGVRLDGPGAFRFDDATHANGDFGSAMLVGVDFPSVGCWQIGAVYRGDDLTYVVWVGEGG